MSTKPQSDTGASRTAFPAMQDTALTPIPMKSPASNTCYQNSRNTSCVTQTLATCAVLCCIAQIDSTAELPVLCVCCPLCDRRLSAVFTSAFSPELAPALDCVFPSSIGSSDCFGMEEMTVLADY